MGTQERITCDCCCKEADSFFLPVTSELQPESVPSEEKLVTHDFVLLSAAHRVYKAKKYWPKLGIMIDGRFHAIGHRCHILVRDEIQRWDSMNCHVIPSFTSIWVYGQWIRKNQNECTINDALRSGRSAPCPPCVEFIQFPIAPFSILTSLRRSIASLSTLK